jgi:hypothetical protein
MVVREKYQIAALVAGAGNPPRLAPGVFPFPAIAAMSAFSAFSGEYG